MDINVKRRMLEIAGMSNVVLTEAKKKTTVKEDAAQSLQQQFGALGQAVVDVLDMHKSMATDPDMAGEFDTGDFGAQDMEGMVKDHINDILMDIFASPEYRQLCTEMQGQATQVAAEPNQRTLDV
jgi:hypothetical protein